MAEPKHVFQALCDEAARVCGGGDIAAIELFVEKRLAVLDEDARRIVVREIEQVLGFRAPDCPRFEH